MNQTDKDENVSFINDKPSISEHGLSLLAMYAW